MEKIYSDEKVGNGFKASAETVQFLLNFSKSLQVVEYKQLQFERILN